MDGFAGKDNAPPPEVPCGDLVRRCGDSDPEIAYWVNQINARQCNLNIRCFNCPKDFTTEGFTCLLNKPRFDIFLCSYPDADPSRICFALKHELIHVLQNCGKGKEKAQDQITVLSCARDFSKQHGNNTEVAENCAAAFLRDMQGYMCSGQCRDGGPLFDPNVTEIDCAISHAIAGLGRECAPFAEAIRRWFTTDARAECRNAATNCDRLPRPPGTPNR